MTRVAGPSSFAIAAGSPAATMRSPRMASACTTRNCSSTVTMRPFVRTRSALCAPAASEHTARTATAMRCMAPSSRRCYCRPGHMDIPFRSFAATPARGKIPIPMTYRADIAVLYEHPEWQKPLFAALERRGVRTEIVALKHAAFSDADPPLAPLYFNQASPSAYVRGNTREVPYALAYMRALEIRGVRVLNGSAAFALELSKTAQAALLRELDIPAPRTWTFNDVAALRARAEEIPFPVLLKPEQGGSGARIVLVERFADLERLLAEQPGHWLPDNLLLLQEYFPTDPARG